MKVCILGSCVTRDCFNYTDKFQVGTYIARTSILSLMSKSLNVSINKLNNASNFQKRMVYWDLNKYLIENVTNLQGQYLIVDFIDERLRKILIDGSLVTLSTELKNSQYLTNKTYKEVELDIEEWKTSCNKFYDVITKKYCEKNIILNKVFLSLKYINKDGEIKEFDTTKKEEILKFNNILSQMYTYFESKFSNINIIEHTKEYLADEKHVWGLEAFHYEEKYYTDLIESIEKIININLEKEFNQYLYTDYTTISGYLQSKDNSISDKIVDELINNNMINFERFQGFELIDDSNIWIDETKYSRSYLRLVNGFSYLLDITYVYEKTKNKIYIEKTMDIIKRWFNENDFNTRNNTMAFHDETTALRLENILTFIIKLKNDLEHKDTKYLLLKLDETAEILSRDNFHTTLTNHGMFQDIALLKYSLLLERSNFTAYKKIAIDRLMKYFDFVFTKEGIAKEHAPIYHLMITHNLIKFMRLARLDNSIIDELKEAKELIKRAENFIVDIIKLDGNLPNISDTETQPVPITYKKLFKSNEFKFVTTNGKDGRCPTYLDKVYKDSGYAIFRDGWNKDNAQVIFTAAYHSAYHKHTDDLNVLFYDEEDILVEAGPNGYNYKDPFTKYAYSSRAHNTLSVLNSPLPRTDGKFEKVKIIDYKICDEYSEVLGENDRYDDINHKRKIRFTKNTKILEVEDYITSSKENSYEINWNVSKHLNLKLEGNTAKIIKNNIEIGTIKVFANKPFQVKLYNGLSDKSIKGWQFPKMESKEPIPNLAITCTASNVKFYTQIILYKNLKSDTLKKIYSQEKVFCSKENIKYIFKNNEESKKLCIVFPAMSEKNKPAYNYLETLKDCKINKLFILDNFDVQGSYLLGKNRSFIIEDCVNGLIDKIISEKNILLKDIIMVGSSKGGYIALYNGIKRKVGNIIVGGPQSKLGNFLINEAKHHEVATYIAGDTSKESKEYLNNILYNEIENSNNTTTKIDIHVSKNDHHYENHVIDLVKSITEINKNVNVDLMNYDGHKKLKMYYPNFLLRKLNEIDSSIIDINKIQNIKIPYIIDYDILTDNNQIIVKIKEQNTKNKFAYYLFKEEECIDKTKYSNNREYITSKLNKGKYRIRIFVRSDDERNSVYTKWITIND